MKYGCIGKDLYYSFSAQIHSLIGKYEYDLVCVSENDVKCLLEKKDFSGINVTVPYKQTVIPYIDELDRTALRIGAVNTIVNRGGRLYGYNTDYAGMRSLFAKNGISVKGKKVLILGSGGTSKTASVLCRDEGALSVLTVSRNPKNDSISYERAKTVGADIIINTTPCGMGKDLDKRAIDISEYKSVNVIADAVYTPLRTRLVLEAEDKNIKAVGGLYMLVSQALYSANLFFDDIGDTDGKAETIFKTMQKQKKNAVLIGMPTCGKTTVGKALAEKMNKDFIDTDEVIFEKFGAFPREIIKNSGEDEFRKLEASVITELSAKTGCVIATGGGSVLCSDNVRHLKQNGVLIYLEKSPENLSVNANRPLCDTKEKLINLYEQRKNIYSAACDLLLSCDNKSIDVIADEAENLYENSCN